MGSRAEVSAAEVSPLTSPSRSDVEPISRPEESAVLADIAARSVNGTESESINVWPDEAAEVSFLAEARERGETPASKPARAAVGGSDENTDTKNLPPLEDLLKRLTPEVRETLDDLFRAKFTGVRRVPAKAFKS